MVNPSLLASTPLTWASTFREDLLTKNTIHLIKYKPFAVVLKRGE